MAGSGNEALHDEQNVEIVENNDQQGQENIEPDGNDAPEQNNPPQPQPRPQQYTQRERELMNQARSDEKKKLYTEIKNKSDKIAELERQLKATPRTGTDSQGNQNADTVNELRDEIRGLREELRQSQTQSELREYKARRIQEIRDSGGDVIESLIIGNTKEDIDIAAEIARAEYEIVASKVKGRQAPTTTVNGVPRTRPTGVPPTPRQPSQVGQDEDTLSEADVLSAIGPGGAGIRNGNWSKIREKALAQIASGKSFRR